MKFIIDLRTFAVKEVSDFESFPGVGSNGQHARLPGYVLAEVRIGTGSSEFKLLHPETTAASGHVDVAVRYNGEQPAPTFHHYSGSEAFIPEPYKNDPAWPTGHWSLIKTVLALEEHLSKTFGFEERLHEALLVGLRVISLPIPIP